MSWLVNPLWAGALGLLLGLALGLWLQKIKSRRLRHRLAGQCQAILDQARHQAEDASRERRLQAEEEAFRLRQQIEQNLNSRRFEIVQIEQQLVERETLINRQLASLVEEEKELREQKYLWELRNAEVHAKTAELGTLTDQRRRALQKLASLSEAEARSLLLKEVELAALQDAARLTRHILEDARSHAEEKARRIITLAIHRYAGEHSFDATSTTVSLPNEELKGRIIGREGRNIRAFEAATGVTVLIDETPNTVVLSAFDPVRREIARETMERLIIDGRIHPSRIEELAQKVSQEMEETIVRAGEEAVFNAGLPALHPELIRLLGRLRFRYSFSQNVLQHSLEVAHLAGLMAAELGLDVQLAKRSGLLHDVGKAIHQEIAGAHALIGAEFLRRHGEPAEVVRAVAAHHDAASDNSPLGILVGAADAISAARPGARSETMGTYLKRVEDLEKLGLSFPGVEKCFAIQAGRELRVFVQPSQVSDEQAYLLAQEMSRKIESDLQYPGQIRVTIVRETRCVQFAR